MNDRQSNWLDMYNTLWDFYLDKQATIDTILALPPAFASFNTKRLAVKSAAQGQSMATTGAAVNKSNLRAELDEFSYGIMAPVAGWAYSEENFDLHANMDYSQAKLEAIKDDTYPEFLDYRHQLLSDIVADLADLGITQPVLDAWEQAIDDYQAVLNAPRLAITSKKIHTDNLPGLFTDTNNFLKNVLDKLMVAHKNPNPEIYDGYVLAREIIDRGHGPSNGDDDDDNPTPEPPDTTVTINGQVIYPDEVGAPGARVFIENPEGDDIEVFADDSGFYQLIIPPEAGLPEDGGEVTVEADKDGAVGSANIFVVPGNTYELNIEITV
jgi:hypothetical protein